MFRKSHLIILVCTIILVGCKEEDTQAGPDSAVLDAVGTHDTVLATGGIAGTGGAIGTGGAKNTGGATATGGATGSGGMTVQGGATSTGGGVAKGGTISSGGTLGTGGRMTTGGSMSTGGVVATGGALSTGGAPGTGGSTGTLGKFCGGIAAFPCDKGQFCEFSPGECLTIADVGGKCVAYDPNGICPANYAPVCGCDGKTYGNDCERHSAGVSKASDGVCPKRE